MGNTNKKKSSYKELIDKVEDVKKGKKTIEEKSNKKDILRDIRRKNIKKYDLNIYVYSNIGFDKYIMDILSNYNEDIFNWRNTFASEHFSEITSKKLISKFKEEYKEKRNKNLLIIPIKSISDFQKDIEPQDKNEYEEKNILLHFNKDLIPEQQPFFMFIDYKEDDFIKEQKHCDMNSLISKYLELNRKEIDFELTIDIVLSKKDHEAIEILKAILLKKKQNLDDFEITLNKDKIFRRIFGEETIKLPEYLKYFDDESLDNLSISLNLINQNSNNLDDLKELNKLSDKIINIYFNCFYQKIELLKNILKKYPQLDDRNFNIIRCGKSIKKQLIKYTGYYNQFGDILFREQNSFYPVKINIAVGGYIGSGKSTLINTILGEKRSMEAQGSSITNYISQYTLKDHPLNFIDFPGFRAKQDSVDNESLFINNIKKKMKDMERLNEVVHCFLFCIKYEERLFSEDDKNIKKIFDTIFKLNIKIFFVITHSEEEDSLEFNRFKENLINAIRDITKGYQEANVAKIFGEHIEDSIIPIISIKKIYHGKTINPFGLDKLFKSLYDYFNPKKIKNYEKQLTQDEKGIQQIIDNNELMKIFKSKKEFLKGLRERMEDDIYILIIKYYLIGPKYVYNKKHVLIYNFATDILDIVFDYYKISEEKKLNSGIVIKKMLENIKPTSFQKEEMAENDLNKSLLPAFLKAIFPILTPIYYILGFPIMAFWSDKISQKIVDEILSNENFIDYFKEVIISFNKGIDSLLELSKYFQDLYSKNK